MRLGMSIRGQFSASDVPIRVVGVFFWIVLGGGLR